MVYIKYFLFIISLTFIYVFFLKIYLELKLYTFKIMNKKTIIKNKTTSTINFNLYLPKKRTL